MAIIAGSQIESVDFSQIAGNKASNQPFSDAVSASARLSAIIGVGWGDRGYGQINPLIPLVTKGSLISGSGWQSLIAAADTCSKFLNVSVTNLPSAAFYNAASTISANSFAWSDLVNALDSARLSPFAANLAQYVAVSDSRTSQWTEKPGLVAEIDFGTEDAARWFFNSGGRLIINSSFLAATSNAQDLSWQQLLNSDSGSISIGAYDTTRQGGNQSQGFLYSNVGYYSLTGSSDQVFVISPPSGPFGVNNYSISAKALNRQAINGGNGSKIEIGIFFDDQYGTPAQPVTGTLTAEIVIQKASNWIVVANPLVNIKQDLEDSGGEIYFEFSDTVSSNLENYNLLDRATAAASAAGVNLNSIPLRATVVVNNNVVIGSESSQLSSFLIPSLLENSTVRVINNGFIVGRGGNGGAGWSWWPPDNRNGTNGGPALQIAHPTLLLNYGTIGGGGGGGGGSSTLASSQTYDDPGASGGGGAGSPAGAAGNVGPVPSYWGQPGTLTLGGAGGVPSPHSRSGEWAAGRNGGAGGNLGQNGTAGDGQYGSSVGGSAGAAVLGSGFLQGGSIMGATLGAIE